MQINPQQNSLYFIWKYRGKEYINGNSIKEGRLACCRLGELLDTFNLHLLNFPLKKLKKYLVVSIIFRNFASDKDKDSSVMDKAIKIEIEELVKSLGSEIESWMNDNEFTDKHGCDGHVFDNSDAARESVASGFGHQNALDYVDGCIRDDEWVDYLIGGGLERDKAEEIIKAQDWEKVVSIVLKAAGPEWFLSDYDGQVHVLSNGKLLYY